MRLLEDKRVIVTGCNRGIGKAILEECAREGAHVYAVVRKETEEFTTLIKDIQKEHGVEIKPFYADFSDEESVRRVAKEILQEKSIISGLINNIGVAYPLNTLAMTKMEHIRNTFEINLFSQMLFTQQISRNMMKNRMGSIVFITSSAAFDGGANIEYSASKAAIIGEVKRLAIEYGPYGIRVNAIAPGLTDTDMGQMDEKDEDIALSMNIMKRKGKPEEIASVASFLISDKSSFITAQVIRVDGGLR